MNDIQYTEDILLDYLSNKFINIKLNRSYQEPNLDFWIDKFDKRNCLKILQDYYPQLRFPIKKDIKLEKVYKDATLKGHFHNLASSLELNQAEEIRVFVHTSAGVSAPVIAVPNKEDFNKIIQSLIYNNNPAVIPDSMGAILIRGLNNWGRINLLKSNFLDKNPSRDWSTFFRGVIKEKHLYQDELIVLSTNPYSNVSAKTLSIDQNTWNKHSLSIRLEHEFTHLYTLRYYGVISNSLHDELIADYIGISKTIGKYNKQWMYLFMGIENYPHYRSGARLENYIPSQIPNCHFSKLIQIIKKCIDNIDLFDKKLGKITSIQDQVMRIQTLCKTDLLKLGSNDGFNILISTYNKLPY